MNILLINHYAGSPEMGMEFRPYYLAREWVKMGHHVRIIAGDFSHLRIKNPKVKKDFQKEEIDGIDYYWLRTGDYQGNGVTRAFTMFRFVGKLWLNAGRIAEKWKPDVVITSSTYPLDTYAGQRIAKKGKAKLIHEVHDMWPITLIELGKMKRTNPFVILMQIAENSFCKHADYIVSLLPGAKEYFVDHGMQAEKFKTVSNGVVLEEWLNEKELPAKHRQAFTKLKQEGKFIICFFGSHTRSYALTCLIEAVQKLNHLNIAVVFVGNGSQKEELKELAQTNPKDSFVFLPPVPKCAIPELLEQADALYVGALRNDMFRFGICMNKLFDSMMSGKPILYAVDAPNNYIMQYHCGISVEAENVEALSEGICALHELPEEERKKMGMNGKHAVLEYFTYEKLAAQFADLF
ncbi:glycosyltransferase family 4 protein [uncultured Clostridium sp.]|uniref:glycosyltransferase family 4 protein n=1 Tax=uncultured Clostridium sp. TaxID=59620 RepID=UPI0025D12F18|nr:glycosyltransferase family 4 protein [uncultured Clostridium sp.]